MTLWDKDVLRAVASAILATMGSGGCAEAKSDEIAGMVRRSGVEDASPGDPLGGRARGSDGAAGLAGRWAQRSSSTESVLVSKLKLVPRTGGGVGMDTRSVMEYAPVRVDRAMTLTVQPDGSYLWTIQLRKPHGQGCFMTTRQEKKGRLSTSGGKAMFATSGGTQSTTNSCTGRTDSAPASAMSETYTVNRSGNALRLTGTGGVDWTFTGG